ncbi:MAG: glycosyltransferase family 9 protein [Longimicrobiales bacterium]|nr:glycosyltransferase family 9 protein [Longimicrobiales bacterium]
MTRPYRGGPLPPPPDLPAEPNAILLVRLSARGDVIFALPLVERLRARWPRARIGWVVEAPSAELVHAHPALDDLIVWDRARWKELLRRGRIGALAREVAALRRRLREGEWEVAIDLQGMGRSGLVTWLSGAETRIGLGSREGSGALMTHRFPRYTDVDRIGGEYRELAGWIGLAPEPWRLDLPLTDTTWTRARTLLAESGVRGDHVVVLPHTTRPQKHWPESRWAPLIEALRARADAAVLLLGGPADRAASARIAAEVDGGGLIDLTGRTSLAEAVAVVASAALVVGVDTGLTHAAHAFARRTVCLFGPSGYVVPPTPTARIVRHDELECVRCMPRGGKPTCGGAWWCMDRITREEIMQHVDDLLAGRPDPRPPARS